MAEYMRNRHTEGFCILIMIATAFSVRFESVSANYAEKILFSLIKKKCVGDLHSMQCACRMSLSYSRLHSE